MTTTQGGRVRWLLTVVLACWCIVLSPAGICQAQQPAHFEFARQVELPEIAGDELVAVPLDSKVFAATGGGFPDVRLLNVSDGDPSEVAFVVRQAVTLGTRTEPQRTVISDVSARPTGETGLEIAFTLDPKKHPHRPAELRLVSPVRNFEHRVEVAVSETGDSWQTLVDDALVVDYSQFMDVRNDTVRLPWAANVVKKNESGADVFPRHFRLRIDDVTQEQQSQLVELTRNLQGGGETDRSERTVIRRQPFRIDRIELWAEVERHRVESTVRTDYPLTMLRVQEDAEGDRTLVTVDSRREPVTSMRLETPANNFSRQVTVKARDAGSPSNGWHTVGRGTLSQISLRHLERSDLSLTIPESRYDIYRLVIENRDSPPLKVTGVAARGPVYELVFLAEQGASYQLAYGHPAVDPPRYDTAALKLAIAEGLEPVAATLGDEEPATDIPVLSKPLLARLLNNTRLLLALIGVLVIVLAWALFRAVRAVDVGT